MCCLNDVRTLGVGEKQRFRASKRERDALGKIGRYD